VVVLAVSGCSQAVALSRGSPSSAPRTPDHLSSTIRYTKTNDVYSNAIRVAVSDGLQVWVEADLASRWLQGASSFQQGVDRLASLAKIPGVVGFKIADELGYEDGFYPDGAKMRAFLDAAAQALRAAAPGKLILIDLVIPQLGCAPGESGTGPAQCTANYQQAYPDLTLSAVDGYITSGDLDAVDISTYLQSDSVYQQWGITADQAQTDAWAEIGRRAWGTHVQLRGRKAMAHPGAYTGTSAEADATLHTYVDIPHTLGAAVVDIWTWRTTYQGQIVQLTNPGLQPNALTKAINQRHLAGVQLITHFTPTSVQVSTKADLKALARSFTQAFMAAGIG
jgi:hypothetical protein